MRRLPLLTLVLVLLAVLGAAPPRKPKHVPLPDFIPPRSQCFYRTSPHSGLVITWGSDPQRKTLHWRNVSGLLFCDDPDCIWCREEVYGYDTWPDPPIRIRR